MVLFRRRGLHFPIRGDSSPRRGPGEGGGGVGGWVGQAVGRAAIRYFTFQIIYCDRANLLLRSAKQYAEAWLTVSPANVRMSQRDSWQVTVEKSPLPFFRERISHAMIRVVALINHSLQRYSPWRLTLRDSLFTHPHTNAQRLQINWAPTALKSARNAATSCGRSSNSAIFLLVSILTFDLHDYEGDEKHFSNCRHLLG